MDCISCTLEFSVCLTNLNLIPATQYEPSNMARSNSDAKPQVRGHNQTP